MDHLGSDGGQGRDGLLERIAQYPDYLALTGYATLEDLAAATPDTPETEAILRRFVTVALGGSGDSLVLRVEGMGIDGPAQDSLRRSRRAKR